VLPYAFGEMAALFPVEPGPTRLVLRERRQRRETRVHVAIGPWCNNNCLFCMEEDREDRRKQNGALSPEHVHDILRAHRGADEVCFTSGEPTLVRQLPQYVGWARELGYPRVSVTTNGRRLAYRSYCEQLVRRGTNRFYISIHGHTARLHDGLARSPGAFEQAVAGLENAASFRSAGVSVHTCTVVTTRNLPHLGAIYTHLRSLGANQVVLNAMQANGRAHTHFDQLFPRYTLIAAEFTRVLEQLGENQPPIFLVDVPRCITESIPDKNRGWVEAYVHHEVDLPSRERAELVERHRADLDRSLRSKGPRCAECSYDAVCEGVWDNYLARFGWQEFLPVRDAAAGRPSGA
jgi:MoaA/NifB/PqqE/SkfB family radical SAM enzyme